MTQCPTSFQQVQSQVQSQLQSQLQSRRKLYVGVVAMDASGLTGAASTISVLNPDT